MVRVGVITGSSASGVACMKRLLAKSGISVRGCFRSEARANEIQALLPAAGASSYESQIGVDASDMDSLRAALEGMDRALLVTPLDYAAGLHNDAANSINMIRAAKEVGLKRIVHVGSWTVNAPERLPILSARFKATEEYLETEIGDDMEWTVLRGGYFMSNFAHVHLNSILQKNEMLAVPNCKIPAVDVRDIGDAAAALLGGDHDENYSEFQRGFIECCGPVLQTHGEIASELGIGLDRTIIYPYSPNLDEWCKTMENPIMLELYKYMTDESADGVPFAPSKFAQVLGREPTSLRQWAADHKHVFKGV